MKQYSTDLRKAVLHALDTGTGRPEVARLFGVSRATVYRWAALRDQTGTISAAARCGRPPKFTARAHQQLRQHVDEHPEQTLAERCAALAQQTGIRVSVATMSRTLATLQITRKKRPCGPESKIPAPSLPGWPSAPRSRPKR